MLNYTKYFCLLIGFAIGYASIAQGPFNMSVKKSRKIEFKLVNNLMVIPLELNGNKLSFVLDTGVSKPILFNLVNTDSLKINNVETIYLQGLGGEGSIEALRSRKNILKVAEAVCVNQDVYVVFDSSINFTPRLGVTVHGIIGYDIFKDFVVEVNYGGKYIRLHKPDNFDYKTSKKWTTLPINLHKNKPYIDAEVNIKDREIPVKLLIDTGGSDSVWLFEDKKNGIVYPDSMYFEDYLGKGLSGAVYGKRSRLESFKVGDFMIRDPHVAYPDSVALSIARNYKDRNGSVAGNILKRFNYFFDYRKGLVQIKKNKNFKLPFYYNNAGIVLEQSGERLVKERYREKGFDAYNSSENDGAQKIDVAINYRFVLRPSYEIAELRETSNAKIAGLMVGDIIVAINNSEVHAMSLQEVNKYFYNQEGKPISIKVDRNGELITFRFRLDNVFKK